MRRNIDSVKAVNMESDSDSDSYCYGIKLLNLDNVNSIKGPCATVKLNDVSTKLLIDSGSSVNILDEFDYGKIGKLLLSKQCSKGKHNTVWWGESIKVIGTCDIKLETGKAYDVATFYVVKGRSGSLMGYPTASQLNIMKFTSRGEKVENEFPHLFQGIGKLKGVQVKINIDDSVSPVAQKPRKTPFHLRDKVEKETNHLIDTYVIEKVEGEPIPWISPIVTPPKKNGSDIRLCVDMREANAVVKRERHTLPTIEELILD